MNCSCKWHKSYKEKGFSLVEVLLVITLLGLVIGIAYAALNGTYRSWSHNEAINPYIASTNTALTVLSREIRSAENPTVTEPAVKALDNGKQLVIYKYNLKAASDPWEQICYRYSGSVLQRAVQKAATGEAVALLNFPDAGADWKDQLIGVAAASQENSFQTDATTGKVDIALAVSDVEHTSDKRFKEYKVASTYFPRNQAPGSSEIIGEEEEEEELPHIPLYKFEILNKTDYSDPLTLTVGEEKTIKILFWPVNATNRNIVFSNDWSVGKYVSIEQNPDNPTIITVTGKKTTPKYVSQRVNLKAEEKATTDDFYVVVK